ncbi:hypothetical protein [uncultured Streptococcus sp.]|uniref:hypothetical protein n=1 Tax=uncultured Streptococcus sp. TaxID=83427 RepID=UPI0025DCB704|nr:hypothetical protein [uncultured Streptococcus sp.]
MTKKQKENAEKIDYLEMNIVDFIEIPIKNNAKSLEISYSLKSGEDFVLVVEITERDKYVRSIETHESTTLMTIIDMLLKSNSNELSMPILRKWGEVIEARFSYDRVRRNK